MRNFAELERRETLSKRERIRKRSDFWKIFKSAEKKDAQICKIYYVENERKETRLAVVVSRRIGNAVERNRIKRKIREIYRKKKDLFSGRDWIIIPKNAIKCLDYWQLEEYLLNVIKGIESRKKNKNK